MTIWYHKRALLYVVQAAKVATKRGSKTLSLEDLLFLMRHSPVKVWQNLNTVAEKFLQDDFSFAAGAKVGEVPDRPWSFHHVKVLQLKFHPIEWNMMKCFIILDVTVARKEADGDPADPTIGRHSKRCKDFFQVVKNLILGVTFLFVLFSYTIPHRWCIWTQSFAQCGQLTTTQNHKL